MSNEKLARRWAERKLENAKRHLEDAGYVTREDTMAAIEHVLATTTPPSMDEVEWDEEKHALTGAVVDVGGGPVEVVMLVGSVDGIDYVTLEQPEHPETLRTVEDYKDAPVGTIVDIDEMVSVRGAYGWYSAGYEDRKSSEYMAHLGKGEVIRWGGW